MIIVVRAVFYEDNKHPPVFLDVRKTATFGNINVSEGNDANKTNASKEYDICHYWHFSDRGSKFQRYDCNGCHDVLTLFRVDIFRAAQRWGTKRLPLTKICHTFETCQLYLI